MSLCLHAEVFEGGVAGAGGEACKGKEERGKIVGVAASVCLSTCMRRVSREGSSERERRCTTVSTRCSTSSVDSARSS